MGNKVKCEIDYVDLQGSYGHNVPGVRATCKRCGHTTESFGDGEKSVARCLVLMRKECPEEEENFYVGDDGEDDTPWHKLV